MMPQYLLDTNILSEAKHPQPDQNVMKNLKNYTGEIATATLIVHELLFGCLRLPPSKKRQDLEAYINDVILKNLPLFDYDLKSAAYHNDFFISVNCFFNHSIYLKYFIAIDAEISYNKVKIKVNNVSLVKVLSKRLS